MEWVLIPGTVIDMSTVRNCHDEQAQACLGMIFWKDTNEGMQWN
jgi:hypothetical protein